MANYLTQNNRPAHRLFYTWSGWPSEESASPVFSAEPDEAFFAELSGLWKDDGLTLLSRTWKSDLIQLALRGNVELAPVEIGVAFQNGLGRAAGCRLWTDRFYVGTFSEYALSRILP